MYSIIDWAQIGVLLHSKAIISHSEEFISFKMFPKKVILCQSSIRIIEGVHKTHWFLKDHIILIKNVREILFFLLFHPFIQLPSFPFLTLLFSIFFTLSYQFRFLYFLRLLIETNRSLQMPFNLNFRWFIFNLGHFTISLATRFLRVPSVFTQLCKPCSHCTALLLSRFFSQHGWHCRLSVTSVRFLS